jgi:hypothetical protein
MELMILLVLFVLVAVLATLAVTVQRRRRAGGVVGIGHRR